MMADVTPDPEPKALGESADGAAVGVPSPEKVAVPASGSDA